MTDSIPESRQMTDDPLDEKRFEVEGGLFSDPPISVSADRPEPAPDVIYLQQAGATLWDWTWCSDKQDDTDIEYRRLPAADRPVERGIPKLGKCSGCGAWIRVEPPEPHICTGRPVENSALREALECFNPHPSRAKCPCAFCHNYRTTYLRIEELFASLEDKGCVESGCGWYRTTVELRAEISRLRENQITPEEADHILRGLDLARYNSPKLDAKLRRISGLGSQ